MDVELVDASLLTPKQRESWRALQDARWANRNPFLSPEYATAVSRVQPGVRVALVRRSGTLIAVLPHQAEGDVGVRLGGGVNNGDGLVAEPGLEIDMVALVRACGLRRWPFRHAPAIGDGLRHHHMRIEPAAQIDLRRGFDAYARRVAAGRSQVLKEAARKMRRLERDHGPIRFMLDDPDTDLARQAIAWKVTQMSPANVATYDDEAAVRVIESTHGQPRSAGFTSLISTLRAGDRLVGVCWSLRNRNVLIAALPAFDPELSAASPGLVLHVELVRAAAAAGVTEIDLGLEINQTKRRLMTHHVFFAGGVVEAALPMRLYRRGRVLARYVVEGH